MSNICQFTLFFIIFTLINALTILMWLFFTKIFAQTNFELINNVTQSLTYSLTYPLTHSLPHSLTQLLTHPPTQRSSHSFAHLLMIYLIHYSCAYSTSTQKIFYSLEISEVAIQRFSEEKVF